MPLRDDEEEFHHEVDAMTAGQLRAALGCHCHPTAIPDDMPVTILPAEAPGGEFAADEQVPFLAGPWADIPNVTADEVRAMLESGQVQPTYFSISTDYPTGDYVRGRRGY